MSTLLQRQANGKERMYIPGTSKRYDHRSHVDLTSAATGARGVAFAKRGAFARVRVGCAVRLPMYRPSHR
jgi:hypothetical protein